MSEAVRTPERTILVVGATGSLGSAIVHQLSDEATQLVITGRNVDALSELSSKYAAQSIVADLNDEGSRGELISALPKLDGVVFAGGIAPLSPVRYLKDADLNACFQINAQVPLLIVRDILKAKKLNKGSSIVCLSSVAASQGTAGYAAYSASKAALEAAVRCLAVELAPKRIRVNCVAPGMVESDMSAGFAESSSADALAEHAKAYPLGLGKPSDVAAVVGFLLSEDARWVTGVNLPVDGGFSL